MRPGSKYDPFDLIERDLVVAAVVELGGAGALVRRHLLGVFEQPAIQEIDRYPGRAERVAPRLGGDPRRERPPHDHPPRVLPRHPRLPELFAPAPAERTEQGRGLVEFPAFGLAQCRQIGVQKMFEQMVRRHFVLLAALFVQAHPPAFALRIIVFEVHLQRRRDAREGVDQQRDQRAIAKPDDRRHIDAVEQLFRLVAVEHRGLAFLDDVLRATYGGGRIGAGENLADDQPVEQHADRGEVLLDRRRAVAAAENFDVSRDVMRAHRRERRDVLRVEPRKKRSHGDRISGASVRVADVGGEEAGRASPAR
jgi:hypothetical protein